MKRPIIGVTPSIRAQGREIFLRFNYLQMILDAGAIPLTLPHALPEGGAAQQLEALDGLLFSGGGDIDPAFYHEQRHPKTVDGTDGLRDALELPLFEAAWARDLPILGICRGIQLVNVARGGTLFQDLPDQYPSSVNHRQDEPYSAPVHAVSPVPGTPLARLAGSEPFFVNSMHHQGVKDVGDALEIEAKAPDGLVEALWAPGKRFVRAVQWHPEYLPDSPVTKTLINAFIESARRS